MFWRSIAVQWTDKIRHLKILLAGAATLITVASLVVSHILIEDLSREEHKRMEVWASALRALNNADETTDLTLVLEVLQGNTTIPVIVTDSAMNVSDYRNVDIRAKDAADSLQAVESLAREYARSGNVILISIDGSAGDYQQVCYGESLMLRRLAIYPYIQLTVVLVFVFIAVFALLSYKRAEQNKVWVGLSKETAHQLGTPISSLMAWVEVIRDNHPDDPLLPEMENDVERLQLIADRFSKIGSQPELEVSSLGEVVDRVIAYMDRRTPRSIVFRKESTDDIRLRLCPQLFEWVIENLCKNAVDAVGRSGGTITISISEISDKVVVDVTDTGKGIRKKDMENVFRPGFTTKKRGWGLGLSLARRIVEDYHHGSIFVKSSELGKGTTFRIELRK